MYDRNNWSRIANVNYLDIDLCMYIYAKFLLTTVYLRLSLLKPTPKPTLTLLDPH